MSKTITEFPDDPLQRDSLAHTTSTVSSGIKVNFCTECENDPDKECAQEIPLNHSILTSLCWYYLEDLWWPCKLTQKTVEEVRRAKLSEEVIGEYCEDSVVGWPPEVLAKYEKCHQKSPDSLPVDIVYFIKGPHPEESERTLPVLDEEDIKRDFWHGWLDVVHVREQCKKECKKEDAYDKMLALHYNEKALAHVTGLMSWGFKKLCIPVHWSNPSSPLNKTMASSVYIMPDKLPRPEDLSSYNPGDTVFLLKKYITHWKGRDGKKHKPGTAKLRQNECTVCREHSVKKWTSFCCSECHCLLSSSFGCV